MIVLHTEFKSPNTTNYHLHTSECCLNQLEFFLILSEINTLVEEGGGGGEGEQIKSAALKRPPPIQ